MTTLRFKSKKITQKIAFTLFFAAAVLFLAGPAGAVVNPGVKFSGGNLTLEAKNATVGELLEVISRTAGVDVFVSRGFEATQEKRTLKIEGEPLEEVLRSLLRGYNYAAIYVKEGNDFRMAAVKIYTEGQQGKEVVPLFGGSRTPVHVYEDKNRRGEAVTVMVSSGGEVVTFGGLEKKGLLVPSQTFPTIAEGRAALLNKPWFALQVQLESQEAAKYRDLMILQKRLESAEDPELKKTLTMIYADETAKFHTLKTANLNKIESLKRISQFRDMTGQ